MTHGKVRQCKITTAGCSVFFRVSPSRPDADLGHKWRSNTKNKLIQWHCSVFRHRALSVCFTALQEQHKEETSRRRREQRVGKEQSNSRFWYADLIHKSSWLLSLVIRSGNRNRTDIERCWNARSSLARLDRRRKSVLLRHIQNHRLIPPLFGPHTLKCVCSRFGPSWNIATAELPSLYHSKASIHVKNTTPMHCFIHRTDCLSYFVGTGNLMH